MNFLKRLVIFYTKSINEQTQIRAEQGRKFWKNARLFGALHRVYGMDVLPDLRSI